MRVEIIDNAVDLDMDAWAKAQAGDYLETNGASTCGIVAVLNHTQAQAWMVHQNAPYMTNDDTLEMLADAAQVAASSDDIEIWLAGCGDGVTKTQSREALIEAVKIYFPALAPRLDWGREGLLATFSGGRWQVG
ncbi:hypothetical protein AS593_06890 [Caulobacter vibrioides]|nr:hypothetical protein AS593_06890 [Caulobacter vibrioides]